MKLRKVYKAHFPFSGYIALTLCPWIFIREDLKHRFTENVERHETTHALQQIETAWIFFLLLYGLEYLIKLFCTFSHKRAYWSISFEQEANEHEQEVGYNNVRKHYAWIKYIFTLNK